MTDINIKHPTRDEVYEYLEPLVEKLPFKASIEKLGENKLMLAQVIYDSMLRPHGKVELFTLTFEDNEPMVGYFSPRDIYFGGNTPKEIWRAICRLIGKPQLGLEG